MPYTSRVLPPAEWPRLEGTEAETVWPHLDTDKARVIVVEDDAAQIVGCWVLMQMLHAECVWIAPDHRKKAPGIVLRLLRGMRTVAQSWGATTVLTAAVNDDVRKLIEKLQGQRVPGEAYVLPLVTK